MDNDPIAALDQAIRGMADLARVLYAHYTACLAAGFGAEEALALTMAFQQGVQNQATEGGGA